MFVRVQNCEFYATILSAIRQVYQHNIVCVSTVKCSIAVALGFVDMTESAQTVRAVGPCLVIVVDRTLLHRSLLI